MHLHDTLPLLVASLCVIHMHSYTLIFIFRVDWWCGLWKEEGDVLKCLLSPTGCMIHASNNLSSSHKLYQPYTLITGVSCMSWDDLPSIIILFITRISEDRKRYILKLYPASSHLNIVHWVHQLSPRCIWGLSHALHMDAQPCTACVTVLAIFFTFTSVLFLVNLFIEKKTCIKHIRCMW